MPSGLKPIVWIHEDSLSPYNPALVQYNDTPAIFVFDDSFLEEQAVSLKRIVFIYECLLELPVEIYRGEVVAQLRAYADYYNANQIITTSSPSPRFKRYVHDLKRGMMVKILVEEPFVIPSDTVDLTRFSRYWRDVESKLKS